MILSKPKKKWRIMMVSPDGRDETRIGTLYECADFWMFAPANPTQDTIIYPTADDVKDAIKMQYRYDYGQHNQFTIGNVEHFF